jgi:lysyl-tRNA synthetase class 2
MSEIRDQYLSKLAELRGRGVEPYPYSFERTTGAADILADSASVGEEEGAEVRVAGRLVSKRGHGKAGFAHLLDQSGRIQIYCRQDVLGDESYTLYRDLSVGDWIGVGGRVFRTRTGEVTVKAHSLVLLAKALRPFPDSWHGLKEVETRYRQRYADLFMNPEVREDFIRRTRLISLMRRYLDERGYLEVETPVLQPLYGGAFARPFRTHHNALDAELYLRISNELYLKRLLVGGFEKVYEFSKDFRNEGIDRFHNPEFTMLELYEAFADYEQMMRITEEMLGLATEEICGSSRITYQGVELDFRAPWPRLSMLDTVSQAAGEDVSDMDPERLDRLCRRHNLDVRPGGGAGAALDELFTKLVQPELIQPTFVIDHPVESSPLAKVKRGKAAVVERFEPFVAGMEIGNAFSEQNDPLAQEQAFEKQAELRAAGDLEAQRLDRDFLRALEYGMPPAGGLGLGIDRIAMLITDKPSIRDVVLFPQLRPEEGLREPEEVLEGSGPAEEAPE